MAPPDLGTVCFIAKVGRLKTLKRAGWADREIPPEFVESVADHSFRVALMAMILAADVDGLDRDRVIKLALIHDLAESIIGDQTPYDQAILEGLSGEERHAFLNARRNDDIARRAAKHDAEAVAFDEMISDLPHAIRAEMSELWCELQDRSTPESQFVKEVDILETYLQSREYLVDYPDLPADSFAEEVDRDVGTLRLVEIRDAIALYVVPDLPD
ncbi:hypothetical protein BH23CHL5_BH23CHL5_25320 [soil metagenome]